MAGLFSNPANWAIVNHLQGQPNYAPSSESGFNGAGAAGTGSTGAVGGGGWGYEGLPGEPAPQPQQVTVDPYARWGGQANYNNMRSGFQTQKNNIFSSAGDAATNSATGYKNNILDWGYNLGRQQNALNTQSVNADLGKLQSSRGILGMVGQGIKSANVMLGNRNAGSSSAVQGLADAYAKLGQGQQADVNNQYNQTQNAIAASQEDLNTQKQLGLSKFGDEKNSIVNNIVSEAASQLTALDAQIANASLPDRIAIEQAKEQIRSDAMGKLQQFDGLLQTESGKVRGYDANERTTKARELADAGTVSPTQFSYTTNTPMGWQGQAPAGSSLPLYTFNNKYKYQA